ncbi:MAG: glycerol-3-phosphate 1-O-acyltransferase PlsY [Burkholderiaceae bacterium]
MPALIAIIVAYLIGSVSFAVIVSRLMGLPDPHSYGSKSPGATNVLRTGNKTAAALTLIGDAFKGWLPVWGVGVLAARYGFGEWTLAGVAIAVFLGHLFPVFHRFAGGKGVATALGVLLGVSGWLALATLATWLIIALFFRYSSLASLVAAVFAVFYQILLFGFEPISLAIIAMAALLFWRHRANIERLLAGKESRIGDKKKPGA